MTCAADDDDDGDERGWWRKVDEVSTKKSACWPKIRECAFVIVSTPPAEGSSASIGDRLHPSPDLPISIRLTTTKFDALLQRGVECETRPQVVQAGGVLSNLNRRPLDIGLPTARRETRPLSDASGYACMARERGAKLGKPARQAGQETEWSEPTQRALDRAAPAAIANAWRFGAGGRRCAFLFGPSARRGLCRSRADSKNSAKNRALWWRRWLLAEHMRPNAAPNAGRGQCGVDLSLRLYQQQPLNPGGTSRGP